MPRTPHSTDDSRLLDRTGRGLFPLLVSLLANFLLAGILVYLAVNRSGNGAGDGTVAGPTSSVPVEAIEALGRVQPAEGVVSVFGPPGDRIVALKVELGAKVTRGQELATLVGEEERKLGIATLDAQLQEATALREAILAAKEARLKDLELEAEQAKKKGESDIEALEAKIAGLTAALEATRAERDRLVRVEMEGVRVSEQEKSQVTLQVAQAQQELNAAQTQRRAAQALLESAPKATEAKRKAIEAEAARGLAQVPFESLKASRKAAEQKLASAEVRAPIDGRVVRVFGREGDTLTNQPILQLADTDRMVVIAEVYETSVAQLRDWIARSPSKSVEAEVDARVLAGGSSATPLKGKVTATGIAPMIAKNTVFSLDPRGDADRRVVEVEVELDEKSSQAVAGFIGLQVRARFHPPK